MTSEVSEYRAYFQYPRLLGSEELIFMLHACFDDCGKFKSNDYIPMAGWITTSVDWENFQKEWKSLLREYGVTCVHTSELLSLQGEYKEKSFDKSRAFSLLNACMPIIQKHVMAGIGVAVDCKALRGMPEEGRKRIGDPASLCFQRCLKLIVDKLHANNYPHPFAVIVDDCEQYSMKMYSILNKIKKRNPLWKRHVGAISFVDDELYPPMQSADIFSYLTTKALQEGYRGGYNKLVDVGTNGLVCLSELYAKESLEELDVLLSKQNAVLLGNPPDLLEVQ